MVANFNSADVSVLLNQSPVTECARLGDTLTIGALDVDVFSFRGEAGERITITLNASAGQTGRASLLVTDAIEGAGEIVSIDRSSLPNELTVTLPASGDYRIGVAEHPTSFLLAGEAFRGDYCVTVDISPGAAPALQRTPSVEGQSPATGLAPSGRDRLSWRDWFGEWRRWHDLRRTPRRGAFR